MPEPASAPFFPDVGIVALVPNAWNRGSSTRQQFLVRLDKYFKVVWCNPPGEWRKLWHPRRLFAKSPPRAGAELLVYDPGRAFPELYRPVFLARLFERLRLQGAIRMLRRAGCRRIVLYVWRPRFGGVLAHGLHDLSIYHIDDEYSFSEREESLDPVEARLIRDSDAVIIHSPALMEKKGGLNPNTRWIPNGVDFRAFSSPRAMPPELEGVRRPIMGYAGAIKKQLDFGLLAAVFTARPEWTLALVGGVEVVRGEEESLRTLLALPNVRSLGLQPMDRMPAFVQAFDVCLLPYKIDGYTKFIYPLKLHEYLAAGKPVVGVPIRTLLDFQGAIRIASGPAEWIEAMEAALAGNPGDAEARRNVARDFDWDRLSRRLAEAVCEGLGGDYPARLRAAGPTPSAP